MLHMPLLFRIPRLATFAALAGWLALPAPASARPVTELEQFAIELINALRADPAANPRFETIGEDLNEGPPTLGGDAYTVQDGPHQPLAINEDLVDSASGLADFMVQNNIDFTCPPQDCLTPELLINGQGYTDALSDFEPAGVAAVTGVYGTTASGFFPERQLVDVTREFLDLQDGMIDDPPQSLREAIDRMLSDETWSETRDPDNVRKRRSASLYGEWQEIGVGVVEGVNVDPVQGTFDGLYTVAHLAHRSDRGPFLTGVAFDDVDDDGFYTPDAGEALGGINVDVLDAGTDDLVTSTTTTASGGYQVEVPLGVYDVRFSGIGIEETTIPNVAIAMGPEMAAENTKIDLPEPSTGVVGIATLVVLGGLRRRSASRGAASLQARHSRPS